MSDEVDDLLRHAMTNLDHQVPEGYFDTLASRTLARLDDPAIGELRDADLREQDDLPAASSVGLAAVALPEPTQLPARPALAAIPARGEIGEVGEVGEVDDLARERAAREARARANRVSVPPATPAVDQ